mmetsp:Transcript_63683/g.178228  ORF Transcript_63683/g.178228 Transcript_63683/m.178228 type:complete len:201 (+) Transcript_63683:1050-1652(+)
MHMQTKTHRRAISTPMRPKGTRTLSVIQSQRLVIQRNMKHPIQLRTGWYTTMKSSSANTILKRTRKPPSGNHLAPVNQNLVSSPRMCHHLPLSEPGLGGIFTARKFANDESDVLPPFRFLSLARGLPYTIGRPTIRTKPTKRLWRQVCIQHLNELWTLWISPCIPSLMGWNSSRIKSSTRSPIERPEKRNKKLDSMKRWK